MPFEPLGIFLRGKNLEDLLYINYYGYIGGILSRYLKIVELLLG